METKNNQLVIQAMAAEEKARQLPGLERDLKICKQKITEMEFAMSEQKVLLQESQEENLSLRSLCEESARAEQLALQENTTLQAELSCDSDRTISKIPPGAGMGLTEVNPEVRAKLAKLTSENEALRQRCCEESKENLGVLSNDVERLKRLKDAFEDKYHEQVGYLAMIHAYTWPA